MPGLYEGTSDFHLHEQGASLMGRESVHEEVLDRVRWFLEECDQPDGIHLLVEANSGWSGVGSTMLALLRDEYEKIPVRRRFGTGGRQRQRSSRYSHRDGHPRTYCSSERRR